MTSSATLDGEAEEAPVLAGLSYPVSLLVDDSNRVLSELFERANAHGQRITSVEFQEPNLEAVFLRLTGPALRDWRKQEQPVADSSVAPG